TDKPTYQPGETLYFRALTLPPQATHWHAPLPFNFQAVAPDGATVGEPIAGLTNQGIGNGAIQLPATAPAGRYGLLALSAEADSPAQQLHQIMQTVKLAGAGPETTSDFFYSPDNVQ